MNVNGFSDCESQSNKGMVSREIVEHTMAQDSLNNTTATPPAGNCEIEQALRRNLHELERLAVFYHKRGHTEQARELYHTMISIQQRLDAEQESDEQLRLKAMVAEAEETPPQ